MRRLVFILAFFLAPSTGIAQDVRVISGEHAGFSRIVLLFDVIPEWTLGRVPGGYEFRPDGARADYDLRTVFNYIPRTRIAAIEIQPGARMFLDLACDCHADAFEIRRGIVIDTKDGPPGAAALFEDRLPGIAGTDPPARAGPETTLPKWRAAFDPDLASPNAFTTNSRRIPFDWAVKTQSDTIANEAPDTAAVPDTIPVEPPPRFSLRAFQDELLAQLSRAVSQGVVEPDNPAGPDQGDRTGAPPESETDAELREPPGTSPIISENTLIETSVDRGLAASGHKSEGFNGDANCIPDELLDLPNWGTPPDNGAALGQFRNDLVGEFDIVDSDKLLVLAKNYIYLGFGIEAERILEEMRTDSAQVGILTDISKIVDGSHSELYGAFSEQLTCPGRTALWAVLAQDDLGPLDKISEKAVIAAFSGLPVHLRRHLGPRLAERFLNGGDIATASAIRNALSRAPVDDGQELLSIEAGIALETDRVVDAASSLEIIVEADGALAANALIRLVDSLISEDRAISPKLRENAEALAFESRGTELGADLARAHVRALAYGGDLPAAFDALKQAKAGMPEHVATALLHELFSLTVETATTTEFLSTVLPGPIDLGETMQADTVRRKIAARLLDLGLTEEARTQLSNDPSVPTPEDRMLYARAYLAEQRPDLVIGYLAGLEDAAAKTLRAKALEISGDHLQAGRIFAEIGNDEAHARAIWRGRQWDDASVLSSGAEAEAAALARPDSWPDSDTGLPTSEAAVSVSDLANPSDPLAAPSPPRSPLAVSRSLLERSQDTRRVLRNLLEDGRTND